MDVYDFRPNVSRGLSSRAGSSRGAVHQLLAKFLQICTTDGRRNVDRRHRATRGVTNRCRDRTKTDLQFLVVEGPTSLGDLLQFGQNVALSMERELRECDQRST